MRLEEKVSRRKYRVEFSGSPGVMINPSSVPRAPKEGTQFRVLVSSKGVSYRRSMVERLTTLGRWQ